MPRLKEHPESPLKRSEILVDETQRSYVIFEGAAYRVNTSLTPFVPRKPRYASYAVDLNRPYAPAGIGKPAFPKRKRAPRNPLPRK